MKKLIIIATVLLMISSCSSSRIISSWRTTDSPEPYIKKVLVLGLTGEAEKAFCVKMEKHLSGDLSELGYNAYSAYEQYGPLAFEKLNEKEALEKLANKGFDAVITIVLFNKQKEEYFVPVSYKRTMPYPDGFWDYFSSRYNRIDQKGYYEYATRYFWESNFYDLNQKKLVFSCQTETFDPLSAESLGHEYGKLIAKEMLSNKVLPGSAKKPF